MRLAQRFGCQLIVTGAVGPKGLRGSELKQGVKHFVEQMKPHLEIAAATGVTIAIENHGNSLVDSPDSMKWLLELRSSDKLAIAFAPYHLPQQVPLLTDLIAALGNGIALFYLWQHGNGCMEAQPKETELLQMPGRGSLDFGPIMKQLKANGYQGWLEIFMHPFPRGLPILPTTAEVTAEINRARHYLDTCLVE
jgi:sugar phosphate isomerase/epimerase